MAFSKAVRTDLDQRLIQAGLEIHSGKSLYDVLQKNRLTHFRLLKNLHRFPSFPGLVENGSKKKTLEDIADDPSKLFLVDEKYLRKEYERVAAGQQQRMSSRNYHHLYNRQFIAYYAVVSTLPSRNVFLGEKFGKDKRDLLISEILGNPYNGKPGIPSKHRRFFKERHLEGLMMHYTADIPGSIHSILGLVDGYYMRKTGDASLFDQNRKPHLPDIKKTGWGYADIMGNPDMVAARVYDILTKKTQKKTAVKLYSMNRKTVIEGLDALADSPGGIWAYFRSLGLGTAMSKGFKENYKNSPKAIYQMFDYGYHKISKDKHSLFDMAQQDFSPLMDMKGALSHNQYANKVIYERLVKKNPEIRELGLLSKSAAVRGVIKLPHRLGEHFREQGFRYIVKHTYLKELPLAQAVITGYANHLKSLTHGVVKLLDSTKPDYIAFDRRGTLIR